MGKLQGNALFIVGAVIDDRVLYCEFLSRYDLIVSSPQRYR